MTFFESIPGIIIFAFIIVLHVLSRIFAGRLSLVLSIVNIALHVSLAPVMLFAGCPLSELALAYTVSLFLHLFLIYVRREGDDGDV